MTAPAILVLHGITMSGASMRRVLGPIAKGLESAGFQLIYPDAPHQMSDVEVAEITQWVSSRYAACGQQAEETFRDGFFWEGRHHDWFASQTDPETKKKNYTALEKSLEKIRDATKGQDVVGILGFSQGCSMAGLVTGLAKKDYFAFGKDLRFGVYLSGFKAVFDQPVFPVSPWPVEGVEGFFAVGKEDALFPTTSPLEGLAQEFVGAEVHVIEGLAHTVPTSTLWVERIVKFAERYQEKEE